MPHWRTMMEKDYLGAWDLVDDDGKPREYTLQIVKVASVALKTRETPKGKRKVVITFRQAKKAFVANTTNCEAIESLYGSDTDKWVGELVTLYQTDVRDPKGKGTIKGIRVRPVKPAKGSAAPELKEREVDPAIRDAQNESFGREPGEEG